MLTTKAYKAILKKKKKTYNILDLESKQNQGALSLLLSDEATFNITDQGKDVEPMELVWHILFLSACDH